MLIFLQKAWVFIKTYWQIFALVAGGIVALILLRQRDVSLADELKKVQDAHDEEIKKIDDARIAEEKAHAANIKKLQVTLDSIQKQYDEQQKELDAKKKAEIEQLVKQYKDDPDAMAKKLSEATGFVVILPEP